MCTCLLLAHHQMDVFSLQEVITKDYTRQSQQGQIGGQSSLQPVFGYHNSPVLDLTRPPSAPQAQTPTDPNTRYTPEGNAAERERGRDRSPPQSKASPVSLAADGIEPVSPPGAISEQEMSGATYPNEQAEQGYITHQQMHSHSSDGSRNHCSESVLLNSLTINCSKLFRGSAQTESIQWTLFTFPWFTEVEVIKIG